MDLNEIIIRKTTIEDFDEIFQFEKQGFGYEKEAILVSELLNDKSAEPIISLLAFHNKKAVGHILFTKAQLENDIEDTKISILAPLAIIPEYQKQGIGGVLIESGLNYLKKQNVELVFVLGHPEYYPKFGFIPDAEKYGYLAPYPIENKHKEAWMFQNLTSSEIKSRQGKIRCADSLNKLEHWRE